MGRARLKIVQSFRCAFLGIWDFLRTERNARIEVCVAIVVCGVAAWLRVDPWEWAVLVITIALVLMAEAFNTAIEAAVDLAMPDQHPLAKRCKDVAAGAVLIAALAAVVVGLIILGPPLWNRLFH